MVVIVATILGYVAIFAFMSLTEPLYNSYLKPWVDEVQAEVIVINNELLQLSKAQKIYIQDENSIPAIDAYQEAHPQYRVKYKAFLNTTVEEIKSAKEIPHIVTDSYEVTYLQVENGVIIVGVTIPDLGKWIAIGVCSMIILYIIVQLSIIGLYVGKKSRYLKTMASKLEVMAGGDLDIRVPIKGRDEMSQLAYHINEMTIALKDRIQKEKDVEDTKKALIANISHDLRTPLTTVLGYCSLLEEMEPEVDGGKMKQYIHTVHEKSKSVSHLVDQLFDYVLLSNHQTEFRYISFEPSVLLHQLFTDSENILISKNMKINYQLLPYHKIWTDVNQFKRVTENIMQNLEKYGLKDSTVEIKGSGFEDEYVVTITNTSEGQLDQYGEDFLSRYFTTDRTSGKSAGLGLAICKEIIEQHGGHLKIKTEGKQFQMIITLPSRKEGEL